MLFRSLTQRCVRERDEASGRAGLDAVLGAHAAGGGTALDRGHQAHESRGRALGHARAGAQGKEAQQIEKQADDGTQDWSAWVWCRPFSSRAQGPTKEIKRKRDLREKERKQEKERTKER